MARSSRAGSRGSRGTFDRIRDLARGTDSDQHYEALGAVPVEVDGEDDGEDVVYRPVFTVPEDIEQPFSKIEYCVFVLLGVAMLWAW